MPGLLHLPARWLRLVLACLALVGASGPAQALPTAEATVAVWVGRPAVEQPRTEAQGPVFLGQDAPAGVRPAARPPGGIREQRALGPPRRLFLEHRALLL